MLILIMRDNATEIDRGGALNDSLVKRALALGCTCTGQRCIGYGKIVQLQSEHCDAIRVMFIIKQALDPKGVMNRGRIFTAKDTAWVFRH